MQQIGDWLEKLGMSEYAQRFAENRIDFLVLPDLTDQQLSGPMRNATFLGSCGAPDSMHVTVKVAIKMGRAIGVSVYTTPPNGGVAGCVDRAVRGLAWPVNQKMDSFVTTY